MNDDKKNIIPNRETTKINIPKKDNSPQGINPTTPKPGSPAMGRESLSQGKKSSPDALRAASFNTKKQEVRGQQQMGQNQVKTDARASAIRKEVPRLASAAGVPSTLTKSVLESEKGRDMVNEAAQTSSTTEEGAQIVVRKIAAKSSLLFLVLLFSPVIILFLLVMMIVGKFGDSMSYADGKKIEGYERLYEAVDKVNLDMQLSYGVTINKHLIVSSMTALKANADYSNESDEVITVEIESYDNSISTIPASKLENWVKLLAKYQIQTNSTSCDADSSTPRKIASNDGGGVFWLSSAVNSEKNYNCYAQTDDYTVSNEKGSLSQPAGGSVFYWNMIDQNFLEEYYEEDFKGLSGEDLEKKKEEYLDFIYLYAKALESKFGIRGGAGGTCEFDHLMVNVYSCKASAATWSQEHFLAAIPFPDYVLGSAYGEIVGSAGGHLVYPERVKANTIAIRSFVLARHNNYKPGVTEINIKSCTDDQVYCDIYKGCDYNHKRNINGVSEDRRTVFIGIQPHGRDKWKDPLTEAQIEELREFMAPIKGMIMKHQDGRIVVGAYTSYDYYRGSCYDGECLLTPIAAQMEDEGKDYVAMLRHFYRKLEPWDLYQNCTDEKSSEFSFGKKDFIKSLDGSVLINTHFFSNDYQIPEDIVFDGVKLNLNNNSSGPAAMTMIVNALTELKPLQDHFKDIEPPVTSNKEASMITMMHRYLAKLGQQEETGGNTYTSYSNESMAKFDISRVANYSKGQFDKDTLIKHLENRGMILIRITNDDCPAGTKVCGNLGSTGHSQFLVIYGYNKPRDTFMIHNPSSYRGAALELESSYISKIATVAVYEEVEKE